MIFRRCLYAVSVPRDTLATTASYPPETTLPHVYVIKLQKKKRKGILRFSPIAHAWGKNVALEIEANCLHGQNLSTPPGFNTPVCKQSGSTARVIPYLPEKGLKLSI